MNEKIKVPVYNFSKKIQTLKNAYDIKFNLHTGFINEDEINQIKEYADAISYDLVGNEKTMIDVYKVNKFKEMWKTFELLLKANLNVKPHITIGLNGGKLTHEIEALQRLKNFENKIDEIIFIVFIPTMGSYFEDKKPPEINEVIEVIKIAKKLFNTKIITLGCMQPKGKYRLELQMQAINYIDKLVQPVNKIIEKCKKEGYTIEYGDECCAL